ncbi:MAG: PDZ domain-containing protein, partial [Myxococcaceae bacterium]|nr:PDZ domain-containing protein [Myxococcaceae bacterium]
VRQADAGVPGARRVLRGAATLAATSGPAGAFSFDGLPAGEVFVSASAAPRASAVVGPVLLGSDSSVEGVVLELVPGAAVSGRVVDAVSREGLPGAVLATSSGATAADREGRFSLQGLARPAWLEASAPGHVTRLEWLSAAEARGYEGLELRLEPSVAVVGVVARQGRGQAQASVWGEKLSGLRSGERCGPTRTEADGGFRLECSEGVVQLGAALLDGTQVRGPRLRLSAGQNPPPVTLEAGEALAQEGVATLDGQPAAGVALTALDSSTQALAGTALADAQGHFTFPQLSVGRYLVQANLGALITQVGPFEQTGEGRAWTVVLERGRVLEGRVEPASAGVQVRWRTGSWASSPALTSTDAQGRFRFEGVAAGNLLVEAEGADGAAAAQAVAGTPVVLRLARGSLTAVVTDEVGRGLNEFTLVVLPLSGGLPRRIPALSANGRLTVSLPPGRWQVAAEAEGFGDAPARSVEVTASGAEVRIALPRGAPLEGTVVDASGAPRAGVSVRAQSVAPQGFGVWQGSRFRMVFTDAQGHFRFGGVSFPVVLGAVASEAGLSAWLELKAPPGGPVRLELKAQPGPKPGDVFEYEGVGMRLGLQGQNVQVIEVYAGSPAESAGVLAGDVLVQVDGAPATPPLEQVVKRIQGPSGTPVLVQVRRGGALLELALRRKTISL